MLNVSSLTYSGIQNQSKEPSRCIKNGCKVINCACVTVVALTSLATIAYTLVSFFNLNNLETAHLWVDNSLGVSLFSTVMLIPHSFFPWGQIKIGVINNENHRGCNLDFIKTVLRPPFSFLFARNKPAVCREGER